MWDLSPPTGDGTCVPCTGWWILFFGGKKNHLTASCKHVTVRPHGWWALNHWATREAPSWEVFMVSVQCQRSMPTTPETSAALLTTRGFPGGTAGKESACQRRRSKRGGFNHWVRKILWRRKRQPTLVVLPEEPHGQRSLAGYSPWGHKELDTTEHSMHAWKHQHYTLAVGL